MKIQAYHDTATLTAYHATYHPYQNADLQFRTANTMIRCKRESGVSYRLSLYRGLIRLGTLLHVSRRQP